MKGTLFLLFGGLALALFLGLGSRPAVATKALPGTLSAAQRELIYARAGQYFTNAILLKPRESGETAHLPFQLAPLLLQEMTATNSVAAPAVVFFHSGEIMLSGKPHPQVTYLWAVGKSSVRRKMAIQYRGIRLILDARGRPVIWELLQDHSGAQVIFVAQSLEAGAMKRFGGALPGRRFAIEADLAAAPTSIVARVIEDNPAAMGPLAHLDASGEVTTLICRCMTAQTRAVERTGYFELQPLPKTLRKAAAGLDLRLRPPADF